MSISYKNLWKLLIDKNMKKKDLIERANISSRTVNKLVNGENTSTAVLAKICAVLECDFSDIMQFIDDGAEMVDREKMESLDDDTEEEL